MSLETLQTTLEDLTKAVCRSLNQILSLSEPDQVKKDKKVGRILKELELVNDAAMMNGLGLPVHRIAQLKTRSRSSSSKKQVSTEPRILTPFQQLMDYHAKHIVGPIPDAAAQGSAIKWILNSFTPELAIKRYDTQLTENWRHGHVSWLTVKQDIGRMNRNGGRDAAERNESRLNDSFDLLSELRSQDSGDTDQSEFRSERTH